jgi:hypothetical protein
MTGYRVKEGVPRVACLEAVNKISGEYILVRASVADGVLYLDRDILLNDGIARRAFALTVKRFCAITDAAVEEHASGLVQ